MDFVRLESVAEKYFNLKPSVAKRKAAKGELPVPAFRLGGAKSPLLVKQSDLDAHIQTRYDDAAELQRKIEEAQG